jgi:DNA-binding transcriptional regulator YiaG
MPNIASAFKAEIARVSRKEIKAETAALKSATSKFRSDIAALKRQVAALQSQLKRTAKARPASIADGIAAGTSSEKRNRFSAKALASQRKRLGLSAQALGKLIGVSGLSIYHWGGGRARPRDQYLPAIAALKTLGKKDAAAALATR